MKSKINSKSEERLWHQLDANDISLGRLATKASGLLRGKQKINFKPYLDSGDHVVVINMDKVRITGKKMTDKFYYSHSGYLGNIKSKSLSNIGLIEGFKKAVFGMLPNNKLRPGWMKRLHIYSGDNHPHKANLAQ